MTRAVEEGRRLLHAPRARERCGERQLQDRYGREYTDHILNASVGYPKALPVGDSGVVVVDGRAFSRMAGGAIASFADLIAKGTATGGKQQLVYQQVGTANNLVRGSTLWPVGPFPVAGAAGAAPAAGTACDRTTVGAIGQIDAAGGSPTRTRHYLTTQMARADNAPHTLVLYDRLWHCRPTLTSGAQAITGVPTRYTSTDAAGVIIMIETIVVLAATAHTWSVTYTDETGTTGLVTSMVGVSAAAANTFDMTAAWFVPLLAGDLGSRAITSVNCGTTVATGTVQIVLGQPLMYIPIYNAGTPVIVDGINSAFNLAEVKNGACLAHFVIPGNTTATTFSGAHEMVASD